MKTKPMFFTVMPLVFAALAIALPMQIAIIYNLSPFDFEAIFSKLTPVNLLLMVLFGWVAWGTKNYNRNIFIALPFINLMVFVNNYIVGSFGSDFSIFQTTLASSAFLALSLSFYGQGIYKVINNASERWWMTRPRRKLSVPLTIYTCNETIRTKSFDVSESGLFAVNDNNLELFQTSKDQEIDLNIHVEDQIFKCRGKIVRKALPKGKYPEGVGIHFSNVDQQLNSWLQEQHAA